MEVGSAYNYEQLLDGIKQQALDKIGGDKLQKISGLLGTAGLINAELGQFGFYKTLGNMFKETAKEAIAQVTKPATPLGTEGTGMKDFQPLTETQTSPEVQEIGKGIFGRQILGDKPVAPPAQAQAQAEAPVTRAPRRQPIFPEEQQPAQQPAQQRPQPTLDFENDPRISDLQNARDALKSDLDTAIDKLSARQNKLEQDFQFANERYKAETGRDLDPNNNKFTAERDNITTKAQQERDNFSQRDGELAQKIEDRKNEMRASQPQQQDPLQRQEPPAEEPPAQPQQSGIRPVEGEAETISNRVVPTEEEAGGFSEYLQGAKANLASDVEGMTQSIKGSLFGRASQFYDKAVNYKQSLESGIDRIQTLRNKATDFAQQLKSQASDIESQGRSYIQQGQEALARGEQAGQDLVNQGQGLLNKSLEQSMNSELFQTAMETAQDKITRGQTLLNNGDQTGMKLLQDGQDQLEQAQSLIKGYGGQARQFGQQIQTEIEGRTQQLNDLAENLMSQAKTGQQALSDIGTAIKSGDVQGAVEGLQTGVKTAGQLAEKAGITGGEELGATLSEAIPVVGEVVSAGLLIASLFTGFAPHEQPSSITTATSAYGV
jgi:hypothetical protein